ncbi:MAG TPA: type II toxin-antitoxin system HicB family antitoxin [Propylenella sp.]
MSWYRVKIDIDGDTFMVTSPAFPEVTTFGDNIEDAMRHGRDAIEEAIAARISDGLPIPPPSASGKGKGYYIQLRALVLLKAGLYALCRSKKVSRSELARRLGWHREQVDRLFRLDHNSRIDQLEAAFAALGIQLTSMIAMDLPKAA